MTSQNFDPICGRACCVSLAEGDRGQSAAYLVTALTAGTTVMSRVQVECVEKNRGGEVPVSICDPVSTSTRLMAGKQLRTLLK